MLVATLQATEQMQLGAEFSTHSAGFDREAAQS